MPNYPYPQLPIDLNRNYRNVLNKNLVYIENDFKNMVLKFEDVVDTVSGRAFDKVVNTVKIEWLPPVNTFADLETTYPNAIEGKTVMTRDSGKIYRFNGAEWIEIQDIDPSAINEVERRLNEMVMPYMYYTSQNDVKMLAILNSDDFVLTTLGTVAYTVPSMGMELGYMTIEE